VLEQVNWVVGGKAAQRQARDETDDFAEQDEEAGIIADCAPAGAGDSGWGFGSRSVLSNSSYWLPTRTCAILLWEANMKTQRYWQGTLAIMVIENVDVMGPQHGYGIARRIEQIAITAFR